MSDNRRDSFRYTYDPRDRQSVELEVHGRREILQGEVVDLSLGGMRIWFRTRDARLHVQERLTAHADIPGVDPDLGFPAVVVHTEYAAGGQLYGLRFVSSVDDDANEAREKTMSVYLMDRQRRDRLSQSRNS